MHEDTEIADSLFHEEISPETNSIVIESVTFAGQ